MPAISKIRFTNIIFEGGAKRYNDDIFLFDGYNGILLLENGGGKTVFIQAAVQAVLPHRELAERKIRDTLELHGSSAHIAVEWITSEHPLRYALTAVTLFMRNDELHSYRYVYEYEAGDEHSIEGLPFVHSGPTGARRPASHGEMQDYYHEMTKKSMLAQTFPTIASYHQYIENNLKIIPSQWKKIVDINGAEGEVEGFFEGCKTTSQLVDRLLIPTVEEALAGNGAEDFVELFDKQRAHFKEHKRLKNQLEEYKGIEERVNHFAEQFQTLRQREQEWLSDKQKAKAFFELTTAQLEENERQQHRLKERYVQLEEDKKTRGRKWDSLLIRELEQEYKEVNAVFLDTQKRFLAHQDRLTEIDRRFQALEIALVRQKITEYTERKVELERLLQQLQQSPEASALENELNRAEQELKGYFIAEEQKITAVLSSRQEQLTRYEGLRDSLEQEITQLGLKEKEMIAQIGALNGEIKAATGRVAQLKTEILVHPDKEQVETVLPQLTGQAEELENNRWDFFKKLNELAKEKSNLTQLIHQKRGEKDQVLKENTVVSQAIANITAAKQRLKEQLLRQNPEFARYGSLYADEASINAQLEEKVASLNKEKQNLLNKERLACRFIDDYGDNEIFTADPMLEQIVRGWQSQFPYLELGSSYIERVPASRPEDTVPGGPPLALWPMIVITSEDDTDRLAKKLSAQSQKFTHPVIVLSSRQARSLLDGHETDLTVIKPRNWDQNIYRDKFAAWKEKLYDEAMEVRKQRKQCDETFHAWSILLNNIRDFYRQYPFDRYDQLKRRQMDLVEQQEAMINELRQWESRLTKVEEERDLYQKRLQEAERAKSAVERRLDYAREYMELKDSLEKARREIYRWLQEKARNQNAQKKLGDDHRQQRQIIKDFNLTTWEIKSELKSLKNDEDYKGIQLKERLEPIFSGALLTTLKERKKNIAAQLRKEQSDRQTVQDSITGCDRNLTEKRRELELKLTSAREGVDLDIEFPIYGNEELLQLAGQKKVLSKDIEPVKEKFDRLKGAVASKKAVLEARNNDFKSNFSPRPVDIFHDPLNIARERLTGEEKELSKREAELDEEQAELRKEHGEINNAVNLLREQNGRFGFLIGDIAASILDGGIAANYPYRRREMLAQLFVALDSGEKNVLEIREKIAGERQQLIEYCAREVQDVRMREDVQAGLRNRTDYDGVVEWHGRMQNRIQRIMIIIEKDLRNHNVELEQFIAHLHGHLKRIGEELGRLPKRTRVKVDDRWKEIYIFTVPEWREEEGKEELRRQIYWMLGELDGARFKDESGHEDEGKMRKAIEKWLQSKQLLRTVMKNQTVKIKCRKVTNDGKVSGGLFSWEESNRWSGGEKWSKNMTLFLGILNYLAEKRQHINQNIKRHSSVIVDNPFGKASSDHVLDPVFFVAEQLGFQIIALTAHADGSFVRNYFPVVYSCRLRQAEGSEKLIVTKEKELKKAFFKDHDPQALERLGEYGQLTLL